MKGVRASQLILLTAILAWFSAAAFTQEAKAVDPVESITLAELRDHMFFLASDFLQGRRTGEPGFDIGVMYAVSQFRQAGLAPICTNADGKKSFEQKVKLQRVQLGPANFLHVRRGDIQETLVHGDKYLLFRPGESGLEVQPGSPVFLGYGVSEPGAGWDDLAGVDLKGKLALVMFGAPLRGGKPALPDELNDKYSGMQGLTAKFEPIIKGGAAGIIVIPNLQLAMAWNMLSQMVSRMNISMPAGGEGRSLMESPVPVILTHPDLIMLLFKDRAYNPLSPSGEYSPFVLDDVEIGLDIDATTEDFHSSNVVAMVEGTDPELKDQYVTVGAHIDHLGAQEDTVWNGADDNASGSIGVLEAAEALAMRPARRSCIFILYTGEEVGLFGSRYFVANSPVPIDSIVANVNLDMIGRYRGKTKKEAGVDVIGAEGLCGDMRAVIEEVNARTLKLNVKFSALTSGGSDQASFQARGIPVAFFFTGFHSDYHQPGDTADKIDYEGMREISQLVYEVVVELANRETIPCATERDKQAEK